MQRGGLRKGGWNREQNVGIYKGLQVGVAERWPWFGSISLGAAGGAEVGKEERKKEKDLVLVGIGRKRTTC